MQHKFSLFFKITKKIFFVYLALLAVFMLFRFVIFFQYGNLSELKNYKLDVLNAFYVGGKFDTSVIAYGLLPVFIYGFFLAVFAKKNTKKLYKIYTNIIKIYLVIISIGFFIVSLIDYFFYKYFQTHINPTIYGIKNDKTSAVIASIWTDYPVIKITILIILMLFIFIKIYKNIYKKLEEKQLQFSKLNSLVALLIFGIYFIAMRGTLSMFPLRLDHTTISTNTFVNELVLNGPFAFRLAAGLKDEAQSVHLDSKKTLKRYKFKSKKDVLNFYMDKNFKKDIDIQKALTINTENNKFLVDNPPNVVFVLIESFSNHYFDLHSKELNLLGELENELPNCYVFRNFLSARNGTVHTLESLVVGTPNSPISQSPFSNVLLESSVANPFKKAGYKTNYLTGDQLGWRNTGRFIKNQNFDNTQGFSFLEKKYINPEYFSWGVHDEYLYHHMFDELSQAKKPQFIFTLTISNHTPYNLPKHVVIPKQIINDSIVKKLRTTKEIAQKNFASYFYAADELGKFIKKIRNSSLGENTIIVATGDHNERGMLNYSTDELFLKRSVPLIVYVPKKYKPKFVDVDRFGSQKDIFPTIYNLSLSNISYIKTGNNLFLNGNSEFFAQNDHSLAANKYGVILKAGKTNFYKWKDTINYKGLIATTKKESPKLFRLKRKMEAHGAAMMLNFQNNILTKKSKKEIK